MSAGKSGATYVVYFKTGKQSRAIGASEVRALIQVGKIEVDDLVSRDGGPPFEFYQYDEFVDLWDADDSFDFIMGGGLPEPAGGVLTGEAAAPVPHLEEVVPEALESGAGLDPLDSEDGDSMGTGDGHGTSPGSPFLYRPAAALAAGDEVPGAPEGRVESEFADFEIPDLAEIDAIPDLVDSDDFEPAAHEAPDGGWGEALEPAGDDQLPDYHGYDPLADLMLDSVTVRDLLYDSSLYTVLAANPGERDDAIKARYMVRAGLMAQRQRALGRSDREQVAAMSQIRHLVYLAQQVLLDPGGRRQYEATASRSGRPATAAAFLEVETAEDVVEPAPSPDELIAESLSELQSDAYEALGEQGASIGLSEEHDAVEHDNSGEDDLFGEDDLIGEDDLFGIDEELTVSDEYRAPSSERRVVDFSDEHEPVGSRPATGSFPEGVRVYESVSDAIDAGSYDDLGPVGEIFAGKKIPRRARRERDTAAHRHVKMGLRRSGGRKAVHSAMTFEQDYPEGLRWGVDDTPADAMTQAVGFAAVAFVISLGVIFVTDMGAGELDYSGHTLWFWGRGLLLIGLALVGTGMIRGEPLYRVGFGPAIIESAMAIGLGVVLGLVASLVAPIYLEPDASLGAALVSMIFIAFSHELFFRGFVTRVLLIGSRSALTAILISCLIYGFFYLSYAAVLGQSGFWVIYYSVLLYGFGLGSIFAVLYWKSRSIWPSMLLHLMVLVFAMLLAL